MRTLDENTTESVAEGNKDDQHDYRGADRLRHRALAGRPSLALEPPDDPDRGQRERHGPAVANQAWRCDTGDAPAEHDDVVGGYDGGQRAKHEAIGKERRNGNGRWPFTECFADAAVQAAAHKEGARLEITGAHDDAEQHNGEHGPRTHRAEACRGHSADEESGAAELRQRTDGRTPDRDVRHQRPCGKDDADTFRDRQNRDGGLLDGLILRETGRARVTERMVRRWGASVVS